MERNSISALHGQITVGTLILQVSLPDNSQNYSFSIIIFTRFFVFPIILKLHILLIRNMIQIQFQ